MIKAVIPALLLVTTAVGPASAAFMTGNNLDDLCRNGNRSIVMGYAVGITDFLEGTAPEAICIPEGVPAKQVVDILCKYVDENPKDRHLSGDYMVILSLSESFPCKK